MDTMSRKEAKSLNLNKYYTGLACINGHVAERYTTSGACSACVSASNTTRTGQTLEQSNERRATMSQLAEIKLRAYPQDWPTLRDTAAAVCLARYPALTLADVVSNRPGSDAIGVVMLHRVLVPGEDIGLLRQTEQALLNMHRADFSETTRVREAKVAEQDTAPAPAWTERP